ncbi:MAG: Xaa-Pro peptidase family protein [archaeon]|nr:Xaa-Pro peptidase family protein [archaeon]
MTSGNTLSALWKENISKVRSKMEDDKVDLLIVCDPPNFHYLIGPGPYQTRTMYESSFGEYLVLKREEELPHVFCNPFYYDFYLERVKWIEAVHYRDEFSNFIAKLETSIMKVQTSREGPVQLFELIKNSFRSGEISSEPTVLEQSRKIKSKLEIKQIRAAAEIARKMMQSAVNTTRVGVREFDIAAEAEFTMRKNGADTFSFSTIASSGENGGVMQEILSNRSIRKDDVVMIDLGATKNCYNEEFTRTVEVKTSSRLRKTVQDVKESLEACLREIYPGAACSAPDLAARKIISNAGLPDFNHPTGHGLGTSVWESPWISRDSKDTIEEGMVLAVEPGTYLKGLGGIRLEENLLVTKRGCEILTKFPLINRT